MRLIDADKLLADIKTLPIMSNWGESFFPQLVQEQATIDAVAVVRCKDCIYHRELNQSEKEYYNEGALICTNSYFIENTVVESNGFCPDGKREVNNG